MSSLFQILDPMSVIVLFAYTAWFIHPSLAGTTLTNYFPFPIIFV